MEGGHSWGCPAWLPAKEAGAVIARHLTRECYYHGFRVLELLPATAVPVLLLDVRRSGPGAAGPRVFPPRPSPSFQLNSMRLHPRAMRRWRRNAVRPRCLYFWMAEDDPCLGPGLNWNGKLAAVDNELKSLEVSIAYVSSLGGGFFLCRYVDEARRCAALQAQLAARIGDVRAYTRTLLHFVYLDIQDGAFVSAKRIMLRLWRYCHVSGDGGLREGVRTAWRHMRHVKAVATLPEAAAPVKSDTEDPFYRQRLLRRRQAVGSKR